MKATRLQIVDALIASFFAILFATDTFAATQLVLSRGGKSLQEQYKGIVELTIDPGFENARVSISVDGQKIAEQIPSPYRVIVDFGETAVEHRITVAAYGEKKRRVQWHETINRGKLPLSVRLEEVDLQNGVFEAATTAPDDDPVEAVELWHEGKLVASAKAAPFRFHVPAEVLANGFVQVTAKSRGGEEVADFWAGGTRVHVENVQVRTVPIFVSVVDRNGNTLDDVDRSLFRILDNESEAKIVEFGKAFDQPIAIALLLDASASMTYAMGDVANAANAFVKKVLRPGDRCSVYAVQDAPRRKQALTGDIELVSSALAGLKPHGRTSLYDAVESAIRELRDETTRRAIVVLTDGGDTASIASFEEVEKTATAAGIPIYYIVYDTGSDTASRDVDRLKHLAAQTGGFVAVATPDSLAAKYHDIEKDLRAQFAIRYQISDFSKKNEWRRVRVMLNSPRLTARTIKGYFTP